MMLNLRVSLPASLRSACARSRFSRRKAMQPGHPYSSRGQRVRPRVVFRKVLETGLIVGVVLAASRGVRGCGRTVAQWLREAAHGIAGLLDPRMDGGDSVFLADNDEMQGAGTNGI